MFNFLHFIFKVSPFLFLTLLLSACGGSAVKVKGAVVPLAPTSDSAAFERSNYRLRVGDTINIVVFGEEELTMDIELNDVGSISYPHLGKLSLIGKSLDEVQSELVDGLGDGYLVNPRVSVTMDTFRQIFVGGEVARGGNFPFQSGLTVGKAIVLAGGYTARAARGRIFVTSDNSGSVKPFRVTIDYVLQPGDIVTVQRRFF